MKVVPPYSTWADKNVEGTGDYCTVDADCERRPASGWPVWAARGAANEDTISHCDNRDRMCHGDEPVCCPDTAAGYFCAGNSARERSWRRPHAARQTPSNIGTDRTGASHGIMIDAASAGCGSPDSNDHVRRINHAPTLPRFRGVGCCGVAELCCRQVVRRFRQPHSEGHSRLARSHCGTVAAGLVLACLAADIPRLFWLPTGSPLSAALDGACSGCSGGFPVQNSGPSGRILAPVPPEPATCRSCAVAPFHTPPLRSDQTNRCTNLTTSLHTRSRPPPSALRRPIYTTATPHDVPQAFCPPPRPLHRPAAAQAPPAPRPVFDYPRRPTQPPIPPPRSSVSRRRRRTESLRRGILMRPPAVAVAPPPRIPSHTATVGSLGMAPRPSFLR